MSLSFLHSMKEKEYLLSAIENGLMFREHNVTFKLSNDEKVLTEDFKNKIHLVEKQLGKSYSELSSREQRIIQFTLAPQTIPVNMLCFTELENRKSMENHTYEYGHYGFIFTQDFIERNNGDRVIYVGDDKAATRRLKNLIDMLCISKLHYNSEGLLLNDIQAYQEIYSNMCFMEPRINLKEFEWRIVQGNNVFDMLGETKSQYLHFKLDDIMHVIVNDNNEIEEVKKLLDCKKKKDNFDKKLPEIIRYNEINKD